MMLQDPAVSSPRPRRWPVGDIVAAFAVLAALVAVPLLVESRYVLGQVVLTLFLSAIASQ